VLSGKHEIGLVDCSDVTISVNGNIGPRSADIVGSLAFLAGEQWNNRDEE